MSLSIRTYRLVFEGKALSTWPATHTSWARLKARLRGVKLPETRTEDRYAVTFKIQGMSRDFMDREFDYRKAVKLARLQRIDPGVRLTQALLLSELENKSDRIVLDRTPDQSLEYQAWIEQFQSRSIPVMGSAAEVRA